MKIKLMGAFMLATMLPIANAQDAKTAIANAAKAMGVDGLNSVQIWGEAQNGNLGQNNNPNQPWPMTGANDYVRAIDFGQPASRATWMTYSMTVQGAPATLLPGQQNITLQNMAWAQQLEIWITPWGFLKGAAANNATVKAQTMGGKRYQVVTFNAPQKSPGGLPYKMVGYINNNLVEKVQTWVENPVLGDTLVEAEYSFYRDANGLKYPAQWVQKRGGWPVFSAFVVGAKANPANLSALMSMPAAGQGGPPADAPPATSEKLADGVYRIKGPYNSMAIEFADYILLLEPGPMNEARSLAVIAESKRVIPNKPIRYGVVTHHHFDHTSGLAGAVSEGITLVTADQNKAFLMSALSAARTLAPDAISKSGKKPVVEGINGDKRVFQDATRTFEVHLVKGLPHTDGLLMGYLPKESILIFADMFGLPSATAPVPNPSVVGTQVFVDNLDRLNINADRVLSIHSLNPDRLTSVAEIKKTLGK